jgi:hypothetical protein
MGGRELHIGERVRTMSGETGRVVRSSADAMGRIWPPLEYRRYDLDGESDFVALSVLMESGEIREYNYEALVRSD